MKKLTFILLTILAINTSAQTVSFDYLKTAKLKSTFNIAKINMDKYLSKDSILFSIGDSIELGKPINNYSEFTTMSLYNNLSGQPLKVSNQLSNTKCVISSFYVWGNKTIGYKVCVKTKTSKIMGIQNYINIVLEDAIIGGEIKTKIMTSDRALEELKKAKSKLELELISQEEYNKIKSELSKFIK